MKTILIVDDDPAMCAALSHAARNLGHEVQTAPSGAAAVAMLSDSTIRAVFIGREMLARTLANDIADQRARADRPAVIARLLESGRKLFPEHADLLEHGTAGVLDPSQIVVAEEPTEPAQEQAQAQVPATADAGASASASK